MKTSPGKLVLPAIILGAILIFFACQKESSHSSTNNIPAGKAKLSVFLTDGPYDFQKVLIDIKSIQVLVDTCHHFGDPDDQEDEHHDGEEHDGEGDDHGDDGGDHHDNDSTEATCKVWSDLQINPGIYDLLTLRNGQDTLLGANFIPQGKIIKIKITLGTNNSIMADSITSPLQIRDNKDYVIIQIRNEHLDSIAPGNFNLLLIDVVRVVRAAVPFEGVFGFLAPLAGDVFNELKITRRAAAVLGRASAFTAQEAGVRLSGLVGLMASTIIRCSQSSPKSYM